MTTMKQKKISEMTEAELKQAGYIMNLKGKDYCTVAYRLLRFREEHKGWAIEKNIVHRDEKSIIVKCTIKNEHGQIISEDFAEEFCSTRLPTIEKASTDAMGRALANLGYATASIASYEEMQRFESRNTTPRPRPTSAIPEQPRTRKAPQPEAPQVTREELEKSLREDTRWMTEEFPWKIEGDKISGKITWEKFSEVFFITNREGKECSTRQYLRAIAGATKNQDISLKCTIVADILKKNEEEEQKFLGEMESQNVRENLSSPDSLFPEKEEQHQYSGEGVGA